MFENGLFSIDIALYWHFSELFSVSSTHFLQKSLSLLIFSYFDAIV